MDFIERWFGISPDAGNGLTELSYILLLALAVVMVFRRKILRLIFRLRHDRAE
jgi:hypothetical protein